MLKKNMYFYSIKQFFFNTDKLFCTKNKWIIIKLLYNNINMYQEHDNISFKGCYKS